MPQHYIEKILPYSPKQLFDLVATIEEYPNFLPWCIGARVLERQDDVVLAELVVNFKAFHGKYTSRVFLDKAKKEISVELVQGPFHHLYNGWKFHKRPEGALVEFDIDFKMRSFLLEKIMNQMFSKAVDKIMRAFEDRAQEIYGK